MSTGDTYRFRLKFKSPSGRLTKAEEKEIEFSTDKSDHEFTLSAHDASELKIADWYVLKGAGYESEDAAWEAGERARDALYVLGIKKQLELDLGDDSATTMVGEGLRKMLRDDVRAYDDVHGLSVQKEHPTPVIVSMSVDAKVIPGDDYSFDEDFLDHFDKFPSFDERLELASSLFLTAMSSDDNRVRLLFLITTVESLIELEKREPEAVEIVNDAIAQVEQSNLESGEKESLKTSLEWDKLESIGHAGRSLVDEHLDKQYDGWSAKGIFNECYSIRSQLVHEGEAATDANLSSLSSSLSEVVSDLLIEMMKSRSAV